MKKLFSTLVALSICVIAIAQDTVKVKTNPDLDISRKMAIAIEVIAIHETDSIKKSKSKFEFNSELTLASRNYWRGIGLGESPSIQGLICVSRYGFELGTYGGVTANGNRVGYGNWVENYLTYKYKNVSLTVDDYFFLSEVDSLNDFFNYQAKSTKHYVEARLKYEYKRIQLMAGYTIYSATADTTTGLYAEAIFDAGKGTSFFAGYLTAPSMLNFTDKAGFTNIGVSYKRHIKISSEFQPVLKTSVVFNPSYNSIPQLPGLGRNPVNLVFTMTF